MSNLPSKQAQEGSFGLDTSSFDDIDDVERKSQISVHGNIPRVANHSSTIPDKVYKPYTRSAQTFAGLDLSALASVGIDRAQLRQYPTFQELGNVDIQALTRSIESGLPSEVGNALDILVIIAGDRRWGLPLMHCGALLDVLLDCMAQSISVLRHDDSPITECDFGNYEGLLRDVRGCQSRLAHPTMDLGSVAGITRVAAQQAIASVMTILRNLAFTEINQEFIARAESLPGILSNGLLVLLAHRLTCNVDSLYTVTFVKDSITLLALISGSLIVRSRATMDIFVRFLVFFADAEEGRIVFSDAYTAAAIDTSARLLSRDVPNRQHLVSLLQESHEDERVRLLVGLLSLSLGAFPRCLDQSSSDMIKAHIPLLHHASIVAEAAATLCSKYGITGERLIVNHVSVHQRLLDIIRIVEDHRLWKHNPGLITEISLLRQRLMRVLSNLNNRAKPVRSTDHSTGSLADTMLDSFEVGLDNLRLRTMEH